jgi:hypothetical protein
MARTIPTISRSMRPFAWVVRERYRRAEQQLKVSASFKNLQRIFPVGHAEGLGPTEAAQHDFSGG